MSAREPDQRPATPTQSTPASGTVAPSSGGGTAAVQLKAALRGQDYDTQVQMLAPDGGADGDAAGGRPSVHQAAAHGISGGGGKLPDADKIQQSFGGYDISNIESHSGGPAAEASHAMGANAYATGNHVVLGEGGKDLHTQAHEAAHVVQQRQGVSLSGGVGQAGDAYEQHADAVADRVVAGESAEDLLAQVAGGGSGGGVQQQVVQMDDGPVCDVTPTDEVLTSGSGGTASAQDPKLAVTVGETTSFDLGLAIPIYGPIKLEGKIAGSYTQKAGSNGPQTEVEGTLYGGLLVDLWLFKLTAGIEGKVKFTITEATDLMTAIRRGVNEITAWKMAEDYVPKLRQLKSTVSTVFQSRLSEVTRHMGLMMRAINAGNWAEQAGERSWYSIFSNKTEREWILWYAADIKSFLGGKFQDLGAVLQEDKVINMAGAIAKFEAIRTAPTQEAAMAANGEMMAYVVGEFQRSEQAVASAVDGVQMTENDPNVGFEASVAFKAGATVQATPGVAGSVEAAFVQTIQDEAGQTQWNHDATASTVVTGKVTAAGWEVALVGDFKESEVELGLGFTGRVLSTSPEAAETSIQSVAQAVRGAQSGLQMLTSPLQTARTAASAIGSAISSEARKFASPEAVSSRRAGSATGEASLGFEVKAKFNRDPFSAKGGSVTIKLVRFKLSAERALGAAAAVGVSGSVERSHTFEVSYG